jgi:hypothetical protein
MRFLARPDLIAGHKPVLASNRRDAMPAPRMGRSHSRIPPRGLAGHTKFMDPI